MGLNKRNTLFAAMAGNALEYYDFTLYGFFAAFLSPLYFPSNNPMISLIASFGAFAAGFLMRPIGGLIFGYLGDRYGRKRALLISVFFMAFPTLVIGLLPTYSQIGIAAPLMIVICRLAQGICTAGEYTGAVILIAEYTGQNKPGFACSLLPASSLVGAIIGTGLSVFFLADIMPLWAWRIPFVMGFIFGLLTLFLRKNLAESPEFLQLTNSNQVVRSPFLEILKSQKRNFICTLGIGSAALAPFYIISVYITSLTTQLGLSPSQRMLSNVGILLMWMFFIPIAGYFSDKIGLNKMMSFGSILLMLVSIPIFFFIHDILSIERVLLAQLILSFCGAFFVAPMGAFLASLFPSSSRYSGIAIGLSCGEAIFGGTAPLIATTLVVLTNASIAPGFYLTFCAALGLIAVNYALSLSPFQKHPAKQTSQIPLMPKLNYKIYEHPVK